MIEQKYPTSNYAILGKRYEFKAQTNLFIADYKTFY